MAVLGPIGRPPPTPTTHATPQPNTKEGSPGGLCGHCPHLSTILLPPSMSCSRCGVDGWGRPGWRRLVDTSPRPPPIEVGRATRSGTRWIGEFTSVGPRRSRLARPSHPTPTATKTVCCGGGGESPLVQPSRRRAVSIPPSPTTGWWCLSTPLSPTRCLCEGCHARPTPNARAPPEGGCLANRHY